MSDDPTATAQPDAGNGPEGTTTPPTGKAPKLDGPFDEARALKLIENLRADLADTKGRLKTREDAEKTELQRAQEAAEEARRELAKARTEAATAAALAKHGLPAEFAEFLTGDTAEAVEAKAATLAARFTPAPTEEPPTGAMPRPALVPGHAAAATGGDDFDPVALADQIRGGM